MNGTFAEYAVVPAAFATPVPDGVSSRDAAPLTCAGVTTYKAIKVAKVAPAETVAIFGIGGLGHLALQYARIAGGFVIGVDVEDHKLAMATDLGADHVVNAATVDPVDGDPAARRRGRRRRAGRLTRRPSTRRSARCAAAAGWSVSRCPRTRVVTLPIFDTVLKGKSVIGSIVGTRNDLADVFALHAAGRTKVMRWTASWTRSTSPSRACSPGASRPASSSSSDHSSSEPPAAAPTAAGITM